MKKYLILLLMGILPYLSLAQNKVENSYLSVTVPPGWHVQKQDMPGTKMELLNFFNDGPILYNMGIIVGIEQIQNPKAALELQMSIQNNPLFHNATFGEIHPATFMGKNTMSVDFSNTIDGITIMVPPTRLTKMSVRFWSLAVTKWGTNQTFHRYGAPSHGKNTNAVLLTMKACTKNSKRIAKRPTRI